MLEELTKLRHLVDDLYELGPRSSTESMFYLEIDKQINHIKDLIFEERSKNDEHV